MPFQIFTSVFIRLQCKILLLLGASRRCVFYYSILAFVYFLLVFAQLQSKGLAELGLRQRDRIDILSSLGLWIVVVAVVVAPCYLSLLN